MPRRGIEILVGMFVLLGIIAFIILSFQVSGLSDIYQKNDGYTITADFENIGGLKPKARVSIAGVEVGRVANISFDNTFYLAKVTIMINKNIDNIPDDSQASILTSGLLGDNYVGLTPGQSDTYLAGGSHIDVSNTYGAVVLEDLVSKFFANQASGI